MDIGRKIKALRGNMAQAELAKLAGVDKAIISKIETGKMAGTIECHKKLAEVFGLKLSELYAYVENESVPVDIHQGNSKTDVYQDFLEILTNIPLSKKMLPTLITLKEEEEKFLEETIKKVERFIIILEGKVEIEIEGKKYYLGKEKNWEKGDSLYSISSMRHRIRNTGGSVARLLSISSPPVL